MQVQNKNILIAGGTSGIGRELCGLYLAQGCRLAVTGRRQNLLAEIKLSAPEQVFTFRSDITDLKSASVIEQASDVMGGIDIIIICSGRGSINAALTAQTETDTVKVNVLGFTDFAAAAYNYFARRFALTGRQGTLAGISSIASFRGSDLAPAYYASKAYVSNYLEGLRKKAAKQKIPLKVCTIIPGYVDTPLAESVGGKAVFWSAPLPKAAKQIYKAVNKGRKVTYITKRWRLIAWLLKSVPDIIYNKV